MRTMHLFAGGGGGMYADLILGHTPVVAVERDEYACDVLRRRKEDGWWPECEIIEGDIRSFSGVRYAGEVDCIHAGFPCQDISFAGKRAGLEGNRSSLYTEALRIFREVRPRYLFLENVAGITSANGGEALNRIMSDLAEIGFHSIRWTHLRASDVGSNHERSRWWCLARDSKDNAVAAIESFRGGEKTNPTGGCWWDTRSEVDRARDGLPNKLNRLKVLGNGQVPLQAAFAWMMLGGPSNMEAAKSP